LQSLSNLTVHISLPCGHVHMSCHIATLPYWRIFFRPDTIFRGKWCRSGKNLKIYANSTHFLATTKIVNNVVFPRKYIYPVDVL